MIALFKGVDILVTDCLRREVPSDSRQSRDGARFRQAHRRALTVLTHLDKSMDYATLSAETPDNVLVGYDGMEIVA